MIFATSAIHTFEDQQGAAVAMMVWQVDEASFIIRITGDNVDPADGLGVLEGVTVLEALALAETIIRHEGWRFVRSREIIFDDGKPNYWEIE